MPQFFFGRGTAQGDAALEGAKNAPVIPTDFAGQQEALIAQGGVPMTQAERAAGRAAGTIDPPYGSKEWVDIYFPEYSDIEGVPEQKMTSNGITLRTAGGSGSVNHLTAPWTAGSDRQHAEATIGMNREQKQRYFSSLNYYRNGGNDANQQPTVDPKTFSGMTAIKGTDGRNTNQFQLKDGGVLTSRVGAGRDNPYGTNATISGGDNAGWTDRHSGVVHQFPDGTKYVPGWMNTAQQLGHTSFRPSVTDPLHQSTPPPYLNEEAGTDITGKYGWPPTHPNFTGFVEGQDPRKFGPGTELGGGTGIPAANAAIAAQGGGATAAPKSPAEERKALRKLRRLFQRKLPNRQ